jgi:ABC-2 type transport system permease protein
MKDFIKETKIALYCIKINIRAEMQLKAAFLTQIIGMILNDSAFILIWAIFFQVMGKVNGWGSVEMLGAQSIHMFTYGIVMGFFYGAHNISDYVTNGQLDNFLLTPRSFYMRIISSSFSVPAIGDIFFGFAIYIVFAIQAQLNVLQIFLTLAIVPAAALIFLNIIIVFGMVGFFLYDAGDIQHNLVDLFVTPGIFPGGLFEGVIRIFFLFVFPALMISSFPIEIVKNYSLIGFITIWGLAIFWTFVANKLLNFVRRKYESGNLIGARNF